MSRTINISKILIKRGTTAQNDAYTGLLGEVTLDTEKHVLRVHDGSTQGGFVTKFSGDYTALSNTPDLSVYQLASEAFSGDYNDLTNQPTIPVDISELTDTTNVLASGTGNITFDATTIGAPDEDIITIQATNADSAVNSKIVLDPSDGVVRLEAYAPENDRYFDSNNWTTANWANNGYGYGTITITGAATVYDFLDGLSNDATWSFDVTTASGTQRFASGGYGYSFGPQTLSLNTGTTYPDPSEEVISIRIYYINKSYVSVDYDNDLDIMANDLNIEMRSNQDINIRAGDDLRLYSNDSLTLYNNSATTPVRIVTDDNNTSKTWAFEVDGSITFPDSTIQTTAWTGTVSYEDLTDKPELFDGAYASLTGKPTIPTLGNFTLSNNTITASSGASPVVLSIFGADSADPPALISREWTFGTDGSLTLPGSIDAPGAVILKAYYGPPGTYRQWIFDGAAGELTFPDSTVQTTAWTGTVSYNDLTDKPTIPADVSDLTDTTNLLDHFSGDYNDLTNKPVLFSGAYADLTGKPTIPADVSDLTDTTNLLDHFSGSYNDLTDKPTIPTVPTTVSSFTNDSNYVASDTTGITGADQVTNMVTLTQAEYDAITPNASTVYFIVG